MLLQMALFHSFLWLSNIDRLLNQVDCSLWSASFLSTTTCYGKQSFLMYISVCKIWSVTHFKILLWVQGNRDIPRIYRSNSVGFRCWGNTLVSSWAWSADRGPLPTLLTACISPARIDERKGRGGKEGKGGGRVSNCTGLACFRDPGEGESVSKISSQTANDLNRSSD